MKTISSLPDISRIQVNIRNVISTFAIRYPLSLCVFLIKQMVLFIGTIGNVLSLLLFYIYLRNFNGHPHIFVKGYVTIFQNFAEFVSATACICYGLLELDLHHLVLGVGGIVLGICLKGTLVYSNIQPSSHGARWATYCASGLNLLSVLLCSRAFYDIADRLGVLPCAGRLFTCVLPLTALSNSLAASGQIGRGFSYVADLIAVVTLWCCCAQLSLKYFVLLPSIVGVVFTVVQYALAEIQEIASKEIETDIYK